MTDRSPAGRRFLGGLKEVLLVVLGALIISALLRAFVFEPFTIPSGSMQNTLQVNDKVVAQKITDFKRGDVIVFSDPGQWVTGTGTGRTNPAAKALEFIGVLPNSSEDFLTKRVIGLPGDRVKCCDAEGRVTVNGAALDEGEYLYADAAGPVRPSEMEFEVVVPRNHLFVLGDHRNASADSRCHMDGPSATNAFVPTDYVVGAVGMIVAPFERWQQLHTPEVFAGIPQPEGDAPTAPEIIVASHC
ncbi:signal peptidase I [Granulicoccus sp. GXG6511]|uniref:signal peptidase I n=1 Tax=Granulicoccus sp. GXG6511 TaxID=3381351 RepID=UPI003D7DE3B1